MLDEEELGQFVDDHFRTKLFRLETLDHYDVATDDQDFHRYLAGEPAPEASCKEEWLQVLRAEAAAGKHSRRVHVVTGPLSDYLRYEFEWGYVYNAAAGEDIRILDLSGRRLAGAGPLLHQDFFIIEDEWVLRMQYDHAGRYIGTAVVTGETVAGYVELREAIWDAAQPFAPWWSAHPEYWRRNRAA
jgi:hypothetical protein